MITIFFNLPYERQLKRLFPDVIDKLIESVKISASQNGGEFMAGQNLNIICFDETTLAYAFSAVRFLSFVKNILETNKAYVKEACIVIDIQDNSLEFDDLFETFQMLKTKIIPDNGVFLTKSATKILSNYLNFEKMELNNLYCVTNLVIDFNDESNEVEASPSIVIHKNDKYLWSLYNFILQNPLDNSDLNELTDNERLLFSQTKYADVFFRKHRFEEDLPQYFIDGFSLFVSIYFKAYTKKHHTPFIYSGDLRNVNIAKEVEKIKSVVPSAVVKELPKTMPDIMSFPIDLLEIIFLLITASKYIFINEMREFLESLGKDISFFNDIYKWLYKNELIFEKHNIFARSAHIADFIESRLGKKTGPLKKEIALFLLSKFENGSLYPSNELVKIFKELSISVNDNIKISIFLHQHSNNEIADYNIEKEFADKPFYSALYNFKAAINNNLTNTQSKALPAAKEAITEFQHQKLRIGEYKTMVLLGVFSLQEGKLKEAISYFSYSLDIATQMNNSHLICKAIFYTGITYFLQNDLKMALSSFYKLSDVIESNFEQVWKIQCLFMESRTFIEIGEYKVAEKLLSNATEFSKQYFPELIPLCEVWYARTLTHLGETKKAKEIFERNLDLVFDASLFLLEALVLEPVTSDEIQRLIPENIATDFTVDELIETITKNITPSYNNGNSKNLQNQYEFNTLTSGYSLAEDIICTPMSAKPMEHQLFSIFYNYYQFKLGVVSLPYAKMDSLKVYLENMSKIANEGLNSKDPNTYLYLYLCYEASTKINGESSTETLSYLSRAFKAIQHRLISISENDIRNKYIHKNSWNLKLFTRAREHKLI